MTGKKRASTRADLTGISADYLADPQVQETRMQYAARRLNVQLAKESASNALQWMALLDDGRVIRVEYQERTTKALARADFAEQYPARHVLALRAAKAGA